MRQLRDLTTATAATAAEEGIAVEAAMVVREEEEAMVLAGVTTEDKSIAEKAMSIRTLARVDLEVEEA